MIPLLAACMVATSFISGVMGMAGGMVLMGVLLLILPVSTTMILHGFTQLCSNGFRAIIHRRHVQWQLIPPYFVGGLLAFGLLSYLVFRPSLPLILILIGSLPFVAHLLPSKKIFDLSHKPTMLLCGFVVVAMQMMAGVSGPLLGVFYLHSPLDRHQIIATKAATQTIGHVAKIIFYGGILAEGGAVPWLWFVVAAVSSFVGTRLGAEALKRMSNQNFRRVYTWLIMAIGVFFMGRGVLILIS